MLWRQALVFLEICYCFFAPFGFFFFIPKITPPLPLPWRAGCYHMTRTPIIIHLSISALNYQGLLDIYHRHHQSIPSFHIQVIILIITSFDCVFYCCYVLYVMYFHCVAFIQVPPGSLYFVFWNQILPPYRDVFIASSLSSS